MTAPAAESSSRLLALDAFRGATMLAMILVNDPGTWSSMYWPLGHARWEGWTPTDLVFPFFVFIVGTALAYSLRKYRHGETVDGAVYVRIIRRTLLLVGLGVGMALFGKVCDVVFKGADGLHLETLRFPGVLQRLGLAYGCAALIVLHMNVAKQVVLGVAILLGYWGLLTYLPTDLPANERTSQADNVTRRVDLAVFGAGHMYTQATDEPTEPEGLLSTLPAIVTALLGYWCGLAIQRGGATWRTVAWLVAGGLALAATGQLWHEWFPIVKKLWTSSFVLLAGGLAAAGLGACLAAFDVLGWRKLARPLAIAGVNPLVAFVGSGLVARLLASIPVGDSNLQQTIYHRVFEVPLGPGNFASLSYGLTYVALWWIVLWEMSRKGWVVTV